MQCHLQKYDTHNKNTQWHTDSIFQSSAAPTLNLQFSSSSFHHNNHWQSRAAYRIQQNHYYHRAAQSSYKNYESLCLWYWRCRCDRSCNAGLWACKKCSWIVMKKPERINGTQEREKSWHTHWMQLHDSEPRYTTEAILLQHLEQIQPFYTVIVVECRLILYYCVYNITQQCKVVSVKSTQVVHNWDYIKLYCKRS